MDDHFVLYIEGSVRNEPGFPDIYCVAWKNFQHIITCNTPFGLFQRLL